MSFCGSLPDETVSRGLVPTFGRRIKMNQEYGLLAGDVFATNPLLSRRRAAFELFKQASKLVRYGKHYGAARGSPPVPLSALRGEVRAALC
jgi:hypothetical protein